MEPENDLKVLRTDNISCPLFKYLKISFHCHRLKVTVFHFSICRNIFESEQTLLNMVTFVGCSHKWPHHEYNQYTSKRFQIRLLVILVNWVIFKVTRLKICIKINWVNFKVCALEWIKLSTEIDHGIKSLILDLQSCYSFSVLVLSFNTMYMYF